MNTPAGDSLPSRQQLLAIIRIQGEIAKLGLDLSGELDLVPDRADQAMYQDKRLRKANRVSLF